jgi:hypothetical protein
MNRFSLAAVVLAMCLTQCLSMSSYGASTPSFDTPIIKPKVNLDASYGASTPSFDTPIIKPKVNLDVPHSGYGSERQRDEIVRPVEIQHEQPSWGLNMPTKKIQLENSSTETLIKHEEASHLITHHDKILNDISSTGYGSVQREEIVRPVTLPSTVTTRKIALELPKSSYGSVQREEIVRPVEIVTPVVTPSTGYGKVEVQQEQIVRPLVKVIKASAAGYGEQVTTTRKVELDAPKTSYGNTVVQNEEFKPVVTPVKIPVVSSYGETTVTTKRVQLDVPQTGYGKVEIQHEEPKSSY